MDPILPGHLTDHDKALLAGGMGTYLFPVRTPDGGLSCIASLFYTWAILHDLSEDGYEDRWCFHDLSRAVVALMDWSGEAGTEPTGWHRHPFSGRRRDHGDPATEYVNP